MVPVPLDWFIGHYGTTTSNVADARISFVFDAQISVLYFLETIPFEFQLTPDDYATWPGDETVRNPH
jgi:hypothetical protein